MHTHILPQCGSTLEKKFALSSNSELQNPKEKKALSEVVWAPWDALHPCWDGYAVNEDVTWDCAAGGGGNWEKGLVPHQDQGELEGSTESALLCVAPWNVPSEMFWECQWQY